MIWKKWINYNFIEQDLNKLFIDGIQASVTYQSGDASITDFLSAISRVRQSGYGFSSRRLRGFRQD